MERDFQNLQGTWHKIKNGSVSSSLSYVLSTFDEASVITEERLDWLFRQVPDHDISGEFNHEAFSKSFADILDKAYKKNAEEEVEGYLPPAEFLMYWYEGNEQWPENTEKTFTVLSQNDDTARVRLKMDYDDWDKHETFDITLLFEGGRWVLDNWDTMKEDAKAFVENQ